MNGTVFSWIIGFLFALLIGGLVVFVIFYQEADAQQIDIESKFEELFDEEGKRCDIVQKSHFFYQPATLRLSYDNTTDASVRVAFGDPATEAEWDLDEDDFVFNSKNYTDNFEIELFLDWSDKPVQNRQIEFEFHTADGQFTENGNWNVNSTQFCKVFALTTSVQPEFPTAEETADALQDRTVKILEVQNESIGNVENTMFWIGVIVFGVAGTVIIAQIIFGDGLRRIKKSIKVPINEIDKLTEKNKRTIKNNQILAGFIIDAIDEIKEIKGSVAKALQDFKYHYQDLGLASKQIKGDKSVEPEVEPIVEPKQEGGFIKKFTQLLKKEEKIPQTEKEWMELFEKQSRSENEKLEEKLSTEYNEKRTSELAMQLTAIRKVLFKQV